MKEFCNFNTIFAFNEKLHFTFNFQRHNMRRKVFFLVFSILFTQTVQIQDHINIPVSFKKIGKIATGLSYGHVRTTFSLNAMKKAHHELERLLHQQTQEATSDNERSFKRLIEHQFEHSTQIIERMNAVFFDDDQQQNKRQILGGLSLGFGIVSFGMSIFNKIEISKLHEKFDILESGVEQIIHVLDEQDHAITTLTHNVNAIKEVVKLLLTTTQEQVRQSNTIMKTMMISNMITNHNAEVAAWGRGFEALLHGKLTPSLIDVGKLFKTFDVIKTKASKLNLSPLFKERSSILKCEISYLATKEKDIHVYIHLPLVDMEPIDLFEHLPVPFEFGNLLVLMESTKNVIATDENGNWGLELSPTDLLQCHVNQRHDGNVYVCPLVSLVLKNIRKTCLGALYFGDKSTALQLWQQTVRKQEETKMTLQYRPDYKE